MKLFPTFLFAILGSCATANPASLFYDPDLPPVAFAAGDLSEALTARGFEVTHHPLAHFEGDIDHPFVVLATGAPATLLNQLDAADGDRVESLAAQGYALRTTREPVSGYWIFGGDSVGTMYGGIDLAERLARTGFAERHNEDHEPYIARRGVKFNIPLDARAPSYDSDGDSAHFNVKYMWEFDFWRDYLDTLARHRYNVLSLWNSHPFNALCEIPGYPDTALPDVHDYDGLVKRMTMAEKTAFWHRVFDHATNRGFDIYWFNWNVYTYGATGKYGIEHNPHNGPVREYSRRALYAFLDTYPQIDAFGVSAGEHFGGLPAVEREKWMREVWGEALIEFAADHPDRDLFFIHRFLMSDIAPIAQYWNDFPLPWDISFKYAVGHMHGYHNPDFIYEKGVMRGLDDHGKKTWLNLRNDDIFYFRWGNPDYARRYLTSFPEKDRYLAGYYMGSDGYVFGKTFSYVDAHDHLNAQLEIDKHWFNFLIWGRLGYDPTLSEDYFIDHVAQRFPGTNSRRLYQAWKTASLIFPTVSQTVCRDNDAQWYVEGCHSKWGFIDIERLLGYAPQPGAPVHSIADYARLVAAGEPPVLTTPVEKAAELRLLADEVDFLTTNLPTGSSEEHDLLLNDLRAMAAAGRYYAAKIEGALHHQLGDRDEAVRHLEEAVRHASRYAALASAVYRDQHLARHNSQGKNSGFRDNKFTWAGFVAGAHRDLEIAIQGAAGSPAE